MLGRNSDSATTGAGLGLRADFASCSAAVTTGVVGGVAVGGGMAVAACAGGVPEVKSVADIKTPVKTVVSVFMLSRAFQRAGVRPAGGWTCDSPCLCG